MKVTIEIDDQVINEGGLKQSLEDVVHHISTLHVSHGLKKATGEWFSYELEGTSTVAVYLQRDQSIPEERLKHILAIKLIREVTGLSLKEAKDVVDLAKASPSYLSKVGSMTPPSATLMAKTFSEQEPGYKVIVRG